VKLVNYNTVVLATSPSIVRATKVCRSLVERDHCSSQIADQELGQSDLVYGSKSLPEKAVANMHEEAS